MPRRAWAPPRGGASLPTAVEVDREGRRRAGPRRIRALHDGVRAQVGGQRSTIPVNARSTLADLVDHPELVATLLPDALAELYGQVARLEAALRAALFTSRAHQPVEPAALVDARLLTIPAVARMLSVPKDYVYGLARQRQIPAVRFGKYVRVRESDLLAWIRDHEPDRLDTVGPIPHGRPQRLGPARKPAIPGPRGGVARRASRRQPPAGKSRGGRGRTPPPDGPTATAAGEDGSIETQ
jgi:excisionase family DNA binding protein